jgi:dipeptidyl aminopeptidase/acylaminoacyl peptidase
MRYNLGKFIGIALLGALVVGMIWLFRMIAGREPTSLSDTPPYPPPGDTVAEVSAIADEAYPPPEEPAEIIIKSTPDFSNTPPTRTPRPTFTPYPSPTLGPGPTSTPVPLVTPAKDAAGTILYLASGKQDTAALYALQVGANGVALETASKRSEELDVTWGRAYPSPDGSRIAIIGEWGVSALVYTASGELVPMFKDSLNPLGVFFNWHPDSRSMLIRAENNYIDKGLWLVDTDTWEHVPLAVTGLGSVDSAAASPDGRKIVYSIDKGFSSPSEVWMVNANGREARLLFTSEIPALNFAWSPDSSQILFYGNGVMVMDGEGNNLHTLDLKIEKACLGSHDPPIWSPESRLLVYTSEKSDLPYTDPWNPKGFQVTNICLIDLKSGEVWPLLSGENLGNMHPTWSPDGSQIAFVSNRSGTSEIWAVNVDGSNLRQVTFTGQLVRFPYWRR